jgi:hypothetical protein
MINHGLLRRRAGEPRRSRGTAHRAVPRRSSFGRLWSRCERETIACDAVTNATRTFSNGDAVYDLVFNVTD